MIRVPSLLHRWRSRVAGFRATHPGLNGRRVALRLIQALLLVVGAAGVAWTFGLIGESDSTGGEAGGRQLAASVGTVEVRQGSITGRARLVATVEAADPRRVMPGVSGMLANLTVKEGGKVRAGQTLAVLSDTGGTLTTAVASAQSAVAQAQSNLDSLENPVTPAVQLAQARVAVKTAEDAVESAKDTLEKDEDKLEELKNSDGIIDTIVDTYNRQQLEAKIESDKAAVKSARQQRTSARRTLKALENLEPAPAPQIAAAREALTAAQTQLSVARKNLASLTVTTPISGTVTDLPVLVGSAVTQSTVIANVDGGGLEAKATATTAVAAALAANPSLKGTATPAAGPRATAALKLVAPITDSASDRTEVVFTLKPAKKSTLRPGMTVTVDVGLPPVRGLVVPSSAVIRDGKDTVIFLTTAAPSAPDGSALPPGATSATARQVKVNLGSADATSALVSGPGLKAGDQVVVTGQTQLTDGAFVTVIPESADPAASQTAATATPSTAPTSTGKSTP